MKNVHTALRNHNLCIKPIPMPNLKKSRTDTQMKFYTLVARPAVL
jgi:hypothetical protein